MAYSTTNRRGFLRTTSVLGASAWTASLARAVQPAPGETDSVGQAKRSVIVLWLGGGPSQIDTFDPKPGHENGGDFSDIATSVPGLRLSQNLPQLAAASDKLTVVRSLRSKEGDHERGTYALRTGFSPGGPTERPPVSSAIAHQLYDDRSTLPPVVSVSGGGFIIGRAIGPAYLGPQFLPLEVRPATYASSNSLTEGTPASLRVDALESPAGIDTARDARRMQIWQTLQGRFLDSREGTSVMSQKVVYENARRLISSDEAAAFDLSEEPDELRRAYGVGTFGQGCLLARRLVERRVPVIEVALDRATVGGSSWDTHSDCFTPIANLSQELDAGFGTLLTDLSDRGLLESTVIVCVGEFGRTPRINSNGGRDHFPRAFSAVLAGGGFRAGGVYGRTSDDGTRIEENPVDVTGLLATVCAAAGVDPRSTILDPTGRPVPVVEADPIDELLS